MQTATVEKRVFLFSTIAFHMKLLLLFNFLHKLIHTIVINAATAAAIDVFTFDD